MKALRIGFWAILFIVLVAVSVTFSTQNNDLMTLNFFSYTTETHPKWQVLLIAFIVGACFATLFFIIELIVLETKNIVLKRINKKLERALQKYTATDPTLAKELSNKEALPAFSNPVDDSDV